MRVAVIGAGLSGVCTAWELALAGHDVTVLERRTGVAEEASFAPTGLASAALAVPWSAPPSPWRALLGGRGAGAASASPLWRWRQARQRRPDSWQPGAAALARLIAASAERAAGLPEALRFESECADGLLVLVQPGDDAEVARANAGWLSSQGVPARWLAADDVRGIEPSLAADAALAGAVHVPGARHTNAREFVQGVRVAARARGVRLVLGREVLSLHPGEPAVVRLSSPSRDRAGPATRGGASPSSRLGSTWSTFGPRTLMDDPEDLPLGDTLECDAIVVCANLGARALLAPLGLPLPVAALRGTSVTVTLHALEADRDPGPTGSVFDARSGIAICRQGGRARLAGGFDATGGTRAPVGDEAAQALYRSLDRWFPGAARWPTARAWHGERASVPDGLPVIGATRQPGVFVNLAHGHHGWAVACGAAMALSRLVSGDEPGLDLAAFSPARLGA